MEINVTARPFWAHPTQDIIEYLYSKNNKFAFGFEYTMTLISRILVDWEHTRIMVMFLRNLQRCLADMHLIGKLASGGTQNLMEFGESTGWKEWLSNKVEQSMATHFCQRRKSIGQPVNLPNLMLEKYCSTITICYDPITSVGKMFILLLKLARN